MADAAPISHDPLHQLWYMISGGKWDFFGGLICSSDLLPTGGSVGPTQRGDGALILNGNTSAAVWTCWEATSCHGAEKPPQQTPWTAEQGHQCCSAEECHCCASQSHCCWCILQRGLCLTVLKCSATEWWYIKNSLSSLLSLPLRCLRFPLCLTVCWRKKSGRWRRTPLTLCSGLKWFWQSTSSLR